MQIDVDEGRSVGAATGARGRAGGTGHEPSLAELHDALARRVDASGNVPARIADVLAREEGWRGRLLDVLRLFTASERQTAYLAGGRHPKEILRWIEPWLEAPLSIGELHLIVSCGGWDPEPFVPLARAGLLEPFLKTPGGAVRRINGELAGGWLSDECALAAPSEILALVRGVLEGASVSASGGEGHPPG